MQTTYENFRYRYDKKENPYHKGIRRNLIEVFLSRIPPSLNHFRAFACEDENTANEAAGTDDLHTSKEKIDIEMGNKFPEPNGISLPEILQNLHYDELEGNSKGKEGTADFDIQPSPFIFEPATRNEEINTHETEAVHHV